MTEANGNTQEPNGQRGFGGGSLLEGIETESRKPIDASWSVTRKTVVSSLCAALALGALSVGAWAWWVNRPVSLPTTAQEAIQVMGSERFDGLSEDRKSAYAAEAARLFRELSEEERLALRDEEGSREAWMEMMRQRMDDMARRIARGEEIERPERQGPPPERRERFQEMTEEERAAMREQFISRMNEAMNERFSTGNSQGGALRSEMMRKRFSEGGGRRGGGGGGRGG